MTEEKEKLYKHSYLSLFSVNYFIQGTVTSVFAVIIPIYLLMLIANTGAAITASDIAFIATIVMIPWSIKLFFGILTDKYGMEQVGRRRPWILFPIIVAGIVWIVLPFLITPNNAIMVFIIAGLIITTGTALSDTALDGLIIDIVPKEQLGSVQGTCWGLRSVGMIFGGPLFAILIWIFGIPVESIFILMGIFMIIAALTIIIVQEPKTYPEVNVREHFKGMFNNSKDWKMYSFSAFNAIIDFVVIVFLSLYILIQMGLVSDTGTALELETNDPSIYMVQAYISFLISIGIVGGAIVGGLMSDRKSRKNSVYISYILATAALLLMLLSANVVFLLVIGVLVGAGMGWRHSSYSAVAGEYSKEHPEMDSTYLSICNSFSNLGGALGLVFAGVFFAATGDYLLMFFFLALIQNIGIIPFLLMHPLDYEFKLRETEALKKKE
ncbi:MAG: MFS transporter [Promethearchaeota archaeon]|nr:MAG: MFS transporter [Candidatus Lokiarchaeota archaeon]